jgi:hypothetical protein
VNERKRRIAENEAIFRSVNQQVNRVTGSLSTLTELMQVVCECGTRSCTERIAISPDEYVRIREDAITFIVKPGHDFPETETVVAKEPEYWLVQKDPGMPAEIARATAEE